jgi:hypothetical protein
MYSVGYELGYGSIIVKITNERLYTDGCGSLNNYILITKIDRTTTKMQIIFFFHSECYSILFCFVVLDKNVMSNLLLSKILKH